MNLIRICFLFHWDITHWNCVDIEIATGGKRNKSSWKSVALDRQPWLTTQWTMPIMIDLNQSATHPIISGEMTLHDEVQSIIACMVLWTPRVPNLLKCNKCSCTFVLFSTCSDLNPNRLDGLRILLRKCIKCDCVITGTLKWPPKRWPGSDTRWLGLLVHGAGVREVRGSKPNFWYIIFK